MATFSATVAASADDAHERDDDTNFSSTTTTLRCDSHLTNAANRINAGMRFTSVTIAQGSTINTATCDVTQSGGTNNDINVDILCENVDDAANFSTTADVTSRARVAGSVQWQATNLSGTNTSPDFAVAVEDVITDRVGWASGNNLVVFFDGRTDSSERFEFYAEDHATGAPADIDIDYTAGGTTKRYTLPMLGVG